MNERASPARRWTVLIAALLGAALTARLGLWQLDRAAQKVALQAQIEQRAQMPTLAVGELDRDPARATEQVQRPAVLQGRWLPAGTVFLDNRTMDGRTGFLVVTPLQLASGEAVLVQRGWAPRDLRDRTLLPAVPTSAGEVRLRGHLAPWPSQLLALGAPGSGPIRQNLDRDAYAREQRLTLLPLSLQLTAAPEPLSGTTSQGNAGPPQVSLTPAGGGLGAARPWGRSQDDGLLRHWWVPTADVSKHYGYAVQWFALSALITGLYVWFQLIRPRRATTPA